MGSQASTAVKPEPVEASIKPLKASNSWQQALESSAVRVVKPEPAEAVSSVIIGASKGHSNAKYEEDVKMGNPEPAPAPIPEIASVPKYTLYENAKNINYVPEDALKEGLHMVQVIETSIKRLHLGNKMRQEVWMRELENLKGQGSPTTLIAVCGATGAGKSSILNAILDDNIVPTSGMRACTAVVTEIAHHDKKTTDADVSFLTVDEWKEELNVLLFDLVDEEGNVKRANDLKSDAGVAWHKVHAVYPKISQEQLIRMTPDQIIARDPRIAAILGTTKNIVAKNSKVFAQQIAKYIDSKDQKRGKKDGKEKTGDNDKGVKEVGKAHKKDKDGKSKKKDKTNSSSKDDPDAPALWPLIRQVNVRCPSKALSTGAILVDLPGVADANAARSVIAKNYMKKCDCIWILAPITRAVDDKTARDLLGDAFKMQLMNGNYDAHSITFIASKCDDISCSEVIRSLDLYNDQDLDVIEDQLQEYNKQTRDWKKTKTEIEATMKRLLGEVKKEEAIVKEHEAHLKALENDEEFTPVLTKKSPKAKPSLVVNNKKRKNTRGSAQGTPKKRRRSHESDGESADDHDDSDIEMDSDPESDSKSDSDSDANSDSDDSGSDSDSAKGSDAEEKDAASDAGSEVGDDEQEDEVSEESLKTAITEGKAAIKEKRKTVSEARKTKQEAADRLGSLKKDIAKAQREKNAFCSLKRSEFSRDVLKEDFRTGLKDLDDSAAEERDPDNFNPAVNQRDYDAIDLPVFTCSSRDYVRLTHQVKGDGEPTCFSNTEDTGIPKLQEWCHTLTISSRERCARNFLTHLKAFTNTVKTYVEGVGDVTAADREDLREKWESPEDDEDEDEDLGYDSDDSENQFAANPFLAGAYRMPARNKPAPKLDASGNLVGITPRLVKAFTKVVDSSVEELQNTFQDGLEEKCRIGAASASQVAVATSDEIVGSMHWATYRATLRRMGTWRRDINEELVNPFTRNIANSWSKVFESDLFSPFESATNTAIRELLDAFESSAAPGLKDRCKAQADVCMEDARVALAKTLEVVTATMKDEQKAISRCLAPHIQDELSDGYQRAMEERGTGSVARQKAVFRQYVSDSKDEMFEGGAETIMTRLEQAAKSIGDALSTALKELAQTIEVSLSVLWEGVRDDPTQVRLRRDVVNLSTEISEQVRLWIEAEKARILQA